MIEHVWSVLCSRSTIDSESNNVSIYNVIEQLNLAGLGGQGPGLLPMELEVVSLWIADEIPIRGFTRLRLHMPTSVGEPSNEGMIDLTQPGISRFRTRQRMVGLQFEGYGLYWWHVEYRADGTDAWETVARLPLEIKPAEGEAGNS